MSWGDQSTGEQKTLRAIGDRLNAPPSDSTENLIYLNKSVKFISGMVDVMQNGVDDANKDILLKIQDAIEDLLIIFGLSDSGDTLNFEWGELAMLLKNFTSIFSLQRLISGDWSQLPFNVQIGWIKDIWDNIFGKLSLENLLGLGKDNLIAIGHFDTRSQVPAVPGWTFDPVAGHTSAGSAKVTANGTDQFLPLTYIPAKAGDKFPVEGWVMRSSVTGSGQAQLRAQAFGEGSAQIGSDVVVASVAAAGTAAWVKISGTFTAPAGTKSVRFGPAINDQVMTGDLRFDDIFATKPKGFLDASWILGLITSVFDMSWLSEISISQLGPAGSQNLLEGTFDAESSIDLSSSEGWEHDPTTGRAKPGSAKATANGTRRELRTKSFKASPGTKLDLSGWVSWADLTSSGGPAFTLALVTQLNNADVAVVPMGSVTPGGASGSWTQMTAGTFTVPSGVDSVRVMITMNQNVTAGTANFDDINLTRQGSLPQDWIVNLIPDLADLNTFVQDVIDRIMNGFGFLGSGFSLGALVTQFEKVFTQDTEIPQANLPIVSDVIKGITGFLSGQGSSSSSNVLADMLGALNLFTGSTNTTATTADSAQGVGSNALTNTVSIQAQLEGIVEQQESAVTARSLWESMDYTADPTFALYLMMRNTAHVHTATSTPSLSMNSQGSYENISISGTTSTDSGHSHSFSGSSSFFWNHVHTISGGVSTTVASANAEYNAYTFTNATAYVGFIRCRSVQEKRLFSFRGYYTAAITDLRLDIFRLTKATGVMTKVHTSSDLAGAVTNVAQWIQYAIPSGTDGIHVQPGDILGIQITIGSGTMAMQGLDSLIPSNPAGFLPRRIGMIRTISGNRSPATINESAWSAGTGFIPYIEAGIDTGQASAPIAIADNFNGDLSSQWMMTGPNALYIASNNLGIEPTGTSGSTGISWARFNTQLRTDQAKVGFTTTSPNGQRQIVWFHGRDPSSHVGLAITSSYATLYTMSGGSMTQRAQVAIGTAAASYEIRYNATTKVYSVWRNGSQITSWTDSGNTAPTGLGNRYGGVALEGTRTGWFGLSFDKANPIDDWSLADVA